MLSYWQHKDITESSINSGTGNNGQIGQVTSDTVGYAPDGSYMTYDDGSMTSYTISMTLAELEPVYDVDIETSGPTMGY